MWFLAGLMLLLLLGIAPIWLIGTLVRQRRDLLLLKERLEALEDRVRGMLFPPPAPAAKRPDHQDIPSVAPLATPRPDPTAGPAPAPPAATPPTPATSPTPPTPLAPAPTPAATPSASAPIAPAATPSQWITSPAAAKTPVAAAGPATSTGDRSRIEELVGSVWLQNIGSVLILLGVFFLILWGYTTGRFGPGVLVAAGAALGITLVWRGDRVARRLPPFGHALIGVGLGTIYLSLYLGHFNLRVLPPMAALPLLVLVAVGSILVGLHYRVQAIAILGVFGAFVPQLMAAWIPLQGFAMTPNAMLAYMVIVNAVVFMLAARAGWSSLDLVSMLLSAITWICQFPAASWGWTAQGGLSVLFTALGLSPLPWLARHDVAVRDADLAVIALAPLSLIAVSWPFVAHASQSAAAILLFSLAAIYLLAALWVDSRRPDRDLWRPLTGAAVMFLTAALQRALGNTLTPMAWCAEGVVLVWLGLRPRGEWLRVCGYAVLGLGTMWIVATLSEPGGWRSDQLPVVYPTGLRNITCIVWMLVGAWLMARGREHLSEAERYIPELWTGIGNLMLMVWTQREATHLAFALEGPEGRWSHPHGPADHAMFARQSALGAALTGLVWMAQSTWLTVTGNRPGRIFLRTCGGLVGIGATMAVIVAVGGPDAWSYEQLPVLHSVGIIILASIALAGWNGAALRSRAREHLSEAERVIPELWTGVANLLLMLWTQREASHLAISLEGVGGRWSNPHNPTVPPRPDRQAQLSFALTGLVWMVQASWLIVSGSRAGRLVLRACGYVIGLAATVTAYIALCGADGWSGDQLPILHPTGLILLASIVLAALTAAALAGRRGALHENERYLPELAALAASALMLAWTSREAHHLARVVIGIPGPNAGAIGERMAARASILAASITSAGWLLEALFLLVLGWIRSSAFLRWSGLVLTGITVLKFLLLDLQTVDVFWRFLTAIMVGVALLGISYAYQRRARARTKSD